MPKFQTFRHSLLFGFMLATLLPLFTAGFFSYSYLSYKMEESGRHKNELLAANVATEISSYLRDPLVTLQQADILFKTHYHNDLETNEFLNAIVEDSKLLEIVYVINDKKIVQNIGLTDEYKHLRDAYLDIDLSGLNILRNIEYLQEPFWTHSFLSPISGKKSIALIYPTTKGSFLVGLFNIGYFHSIITHHSRKESIETMVLDEVGKSIFHPDLKKVEEQYSFANIQPFTKAQIGDFGTFEYTINGIVFTGSTCNIPKTTWLIMVTQPLAKAQQPIRSLGNFFLLAVVVSILIVVPLALRQSRRLLKPLRDLQENMQAVADGDYSDIISKQPHEEFEQVANHFQQMANAINRREQLLEINEERLVSLLELHNTKQLGEDDLLEFALEKAVKLARSEVGYIYFIEDGKPDAILWSTDTEDFCQKYGFSSDYLSKLGLWQECINKKNYVIKNRVSQDLNNTLSGTSNVTVLRQLCVPIFDEAKIVALVGVINKESNYDETDARQLSLYFSNTWDIIQQKRSDRDRVNLTDKLAQAQKLEAIGTLAGGIAHDFNNVLMVIMGNTELARDNVLSPEKVGKDLDEIFKGAIRARDLVNQILAFSRHSAGGMKAFNIKPIVKEAVKLLRSSIPANIEVRQNIAVDCYPVLSEPGQINQIIMYLSTNAYQAMGEMDGVVEISLFSVSLKQDLFFDKKVVVTSGEYMQLVVSDTGKGIPEENLERVFEPYFTTKEKGQGTGLGLAVVHGIVKSLHGAITIESELGKGTTFTIYLPVVEKVKEDDNQILTGNLPRGSENILYVDDDEAVASANSRILENLGYSVSTFSSSTLAIKEFLEKPEAYDLVLTDMAMPGMTGEKFAQRVMKIRPDIPVIICTGFSEQLDETRAKEIGVKELLMKPILKVDLAITVRKVLGYSR